MPDNWWKRTFPFSSYWYDRLTQGVGEEIDWLRSGYGTRGEFSRAGKPTSQIATVSPYAQNILNRPKSSQPFGQYSVEEEPFRAYTKPLIEQTNQEHKTGMQNILLELYAQRGGLPSSKQDWLLNMSAEDLNKEYMREQDRQSQRGVLASAQGMQVPDRVAQLANMALSVGADPNDVDTIMRGIEAAKGINITQFTQSIVNAQQSLATMYGSKAGQFFTERNRTEGAALAKAMPDLFGKYKKLGRALGGGGAGGWAKAGAGIAKGEGEPQIMERPYQMEYANESLETEDFLNWLVSSPDAQSALAIKESEFKSRYPDLVKAFKTFTDNGGSSRNILAWAYSNPTVMEYIKEVDKGGEPTPKRTPRWVRNA